MKARWFGVLLSAAAVLAGCESSPEPADAIGTTSSTIATTTALATPVPNETSSLIYGLLTDSDEKGLTAGYIEGACDGAARQRART